MYVFWRFTPLWYYVLKEAQVAASGLHLGPVAGRIVAEVLIGLIQSDPNSNVNVGPSWTPTVPISNASLGFRMVDFLTYAGVDPATRRAQTRPTPRGKACSADSKTPSTSCSSCSCSSFSSEHGGCP
jgi:hypothetical protein